VEKILLYIKHNLKVVWTLIEFCNEVCLKIIYKKQFALLKEQHYSLRSTNNEFQYRRITIADQEMLQKFLDFQEKDRIKYFNPHSFTSGGLRAVLKSGNYVTFGYFFENQLIGYFFMRLFVNKKIFLGYIVDSNYAGKKIGKDMVRIMYRLAKSLGWEAYATIAKQNLPSLKLHKHEVVKQLPNEYMLVRLID